jgi:cell wall-associated NlpC family hydrolase
MRCEAGGGDALAAAALALIGTPFRLHGRDPATGLDCVGLVSAALAAIGRPMALPNGYRLRARDVSALVDAVELSGAAAALGPTARGDVAVVRLGPCQFHMLITLGSTGFVHAHAGLKCVVASDGPIDWPIIYRWRLIDQRN